MNIVYPLLNEECWICKDNISIYVKYCECVGNISYVHKKCLNTWINVSHKTKCDFCNASYKCNYVLDIPKYFRNIYQSLFVVLLLMLIISLLFLHQSPFHTTSLFIKSFLCVFLFTILMHFLFIAKKMYVISSVLSVMPYTTEHSP